MRFRAPSEAITRAPHRLDPWHDPTEVEPPDPSDNASSPGLSCPTTHSGFADPLDGGGSLRHRVPRAGFGYPLRDLHREACRCRSIGASLGFALQGVLLDTMGTPFGARALLTLPQPVDLPGGGTDRGRLQGLVPVPNAFCRRSPREPTVAAFLSFPSSESSPHPSGSSLVVTMPALTSFGGLTSPTTWIPGHHGTGWIGMVHFRTAYSLEVSHLPTVTALRSPPRGAGSWFRLPWDGA